MTDSHHDLSPEAWLPLFAAACDDVLNDADRHTLVALLRSNETARREYVAYRDLHAALLWRYREGSKPAELVTRAPHVSRRRALWLALAASFVMLVVWRTSQPDVQVDLAPLGVIAQLADGRVQSSIGSVSQGESLSATRYTLDGGIVGLRLTNGVALIVEGPADFALRSAMLVELRQGRATANVPPTAIGFTMTTPHGRIVDQGTEFGVAVDNGQVTDVEVFSGQVDVAATGSDPSSRMIRLNEGDARRLIAGRVEPTEAVEDRPAWTRNLLTTGEIRELGGPTPVVSIEPPQSLEPGQLADAERFFVLCERRDVILERDLPAARAPMKGRFAEVVQSTPISAGTKVDIFLIHYDPAAGVTLPRPTRHSLVRFRGQVLAALTTPAELAATDHWLGSPHTRYPDRSTTQLPASWFFRMQPLDVAKARLAGSFYFGGVGRRTDFVQVRVLVAAQETQAE